MFPPFHAGVAYLVYAAYTRTRSQQPDGAAVIALVVGALLPDLVDQPLYYAFDLPSTRTVAHSLLVAVPVVVLAVLVVRRSSYPDSIGTGFAIGYLSHPPADAFWPLILGIEDELGFLLWPVVHSPEYVGQKPLFAVDGFTVTTLWFELPVLALVVILWWRDGFPGLALVREWLD